MKALPNLIEVLGHVRGIGPLHYCPRSPGRVQYVMTVEARRDSSVVEARNAVRRVDRQALRSSGRHASKPVELAVELKTVPVTFLDLVCAVGCMSDAARLQNVALASTP